MKISANTLTRAALAIVSGFALALAFPKFDLSPLAWVGFVPLFYAFEGESLKRVLGWSYLAGVACYSASLYWVVITLTTFTEVRFVLAVLPMLALAAVVAIYFAIAVWAGEFIARRLRIPIVVTMPIAWAAVEWVRSFFPLGFPWNLLGESAWQNLDLIQFAEFTGTYGVSALIVLFNATVFVVLFRRDNRRVQIASLSAVTLLMVAALVFGSYRVRQVESIRPAGKFRAAMVQGNIPQTLKWNPDYLNQSFKVYVDETIDASRHGVDVVIWPESAAEFLFQPDDHYPPQFADEAAYREATLKLARATGDALLFGAPALGSEDGRRGFFNRA
ncbi:MAG TPA: apolipoprotein N-acyltransferase, partial [Candidatus Binataceae bacterium]|nr:apolipoprotein N-acyltransferase [Candidatus Binataceae bacterium]